MCILKLVVLDDIIAYNQDEVQPIWIPLVGNIAIYIEISTIWID